MKEQGKYKNRQVSCLKNQDGGVLLIFAFLLPVFIGIAALAVDIGYVAITRNQLQNVADAAALAGAGKLGSIYEAQIPPLSLNSADADTVENVALAVGRSNETAGQQPYIDENNDVEIGFWDSLTNTFSNSPPTGRIPNAVRVTARPSGGGAIPLGSVTTFFANIFGIRNVGVSATATASLTSPCNMEPGSLSPIVISADSPYCNDDPEIVFTANDPDRPPCAGWETFDDVANTNNMQNLLNTLLSQIPTCTATCPHSTTNFDIPGKIVGDTTHVINGLTTPTWQCFQDLYRCARTGIDWTISVPVVQRPCGQINQVPVIISFATVTITGVTIGEGSNIVQEGDYCGDSPCIKAYVVCDNVIPERGGGCAFYGTYGMIPGIVDKSPAL